jgi:hypothetical protein
MTYRRTNIRRIAVATLLALAGGCDESDDSTGDTAAGTSSPGTTEGTDIGDDTRADEGTGAMGTFPCGNGACELGTEICVIEEVCSTCLALPEACDATSSCGCLDGVDITMLPESPCAEAGVCAEQSGGGLVVSCPDNPEAGCG